MLEGIIIFVAGYACGMYNETIKEFISDQIDKIFRKNEENNDMQ